MTPRRVLLVDDDPAVRLLIKTTLPEDEFEVVEAQDGEDALDRVREEAPALVVLDWRMPEQSGEEVLRVLKRRDERMPVIVLTAERELGAREIAERLGADEFLTKPFSPLQLLATIERLLAKRPVDQAP